MHQRVLFSKFPGSSNRPLAHFSWLLTGVQWVHKEAVNTSFSPGKQIGTPKKDIGSLTSCVSSWTMWEPRQTSRLHIACGSSVWPCPGALFTNMPENRMMMPAVPEHRLIPMHTHPHIHTRTRTRTGGWGWGKTEAEGDLWQWVEHWPQNKKGFGIKKWVYGTAVCLWWCEIEFLCQRGIYCVFNQIRLFVSFLPLASNPEIP